MAVKKLDKETRRKINDARRMVEKLAALDGNEAETRRRVERIFENIMGYDVFDHLSRERAVKGAGETEHVDFAVQLQPGPDVEPTIMVELKRVGVGLAKKHLKQVSSYALDSGCEWILLTNSRDWKLYHVEFGQPPEVRLIEQWDLLSDDVAQLMSKFETISYKSVKKGSLKALWEKATVLSPESLLAALADPDSLRVLRRILRKNTAVMVTQDDLVKGVKKLLNENAANILSGIKIQTPDKRQQRKRMSRDKSKPEDTQDKVSSPSPPDQSDIKNLAGKHGISDDYSRATE